jgi:hypothetical protein
MGFSTGDGFPRIDGMVVVTSVFSLDQYMHVFSLVR